MINDTSQTAERTDFQIGMSMLATEIERFSVILLGRYPITEVGEGMGEPKYGNHSIFFVAALRKKVARFEKVFYGRIVFARIALRAGESSVR